MSTFIGALASLPGNVITAYLIDKVGRIYTLAGSLALSGVSIFFIFVVQTYSEVVGVMCAYSGLSVAGWNALNFVIIEVFPTEQRSTAFGLFGVFGRLGAIGGNLVFGAFITLHPAVPLTVTAISMIVAGATTLWLPETKGKVLL